MVNPNCHVSIRVESLRLKNKVAVEVWVTPQSVKTLDYITHIELQDFTTLNNLPMSELWPSR